MGSSNSSARRRMEDEASSQNASSNNQDSDGSENNDLASILSYLIRSGQVRIMQSDDIFEDHTEYLSDDNDIVYPRNLPKATSKPDTSNIEGSAIKQQMLLDTGLCHKYHAGSTTLSISKLLQKREVGMSYGKNFSRGDCCAVSSKYLPNIYSVVARYRHKVFCGTYSQDGNIFLSACQDRCIRLYDTTKGSFKLKKTVHAKDVGWSVLDCAFSPDGNYLIYTSWSDIIHLCGVHEEDETHASLHLCPDTDHSFCIFSVAFSQDNKEIMGGANDGCLYVFDRERNERTLKIDAHEDDVNAVAFADDSSNILFSGADDGLCKVWDRRTLRTECEPEPVGILAGHTDGITYIDSKRDSRHLISNCKDQSIKLWDMRKFSSEDTVLETKRAVSKQNWDYRWQQVPSRVRRKHQIAGDNSLMTYNQHCILNTLVRCHFSPQFSTGQRYIYTGCASGAVIIYDVLTGEQVTSLEGHLACVRDVSWHPYENNIVSSSWDCTVASWVYEGEEDPDEFTSQESDSESDDDDDDEETVRPRRSRRLQEKGNKQRSRRCNRRRRVCLS